MPLSEASSKGQSVLILLGIAIGVSVQVFIGSLIQGLQKSLVDSTIGNASQITIRSTDDKGTMDNWQEILDVVLDDNPEILNVTAVTDAPGFALVEERAYPVLVRGLDFETAEGIYKLSERIYEGKAPHSADEIIVGREFAGELSLETGDTLILQTAQGVSQEYRISGLFDLKVAALNKSWVVGLRETVQGLFDLEGQATAIEMQTLTVFEADAAADGSQWTKRIQPHDPGICDDIRCTGNRQCPGHHRNTKIQADRYSEGHGHQRPYSQCHLSVPGLAVGAGRSRAVWIGIGSGLQHLCVESGWYAGSCPVYQSGLYCPFSCSCPVGGRHGSPPACTPLV